MSRGEKRALLQLLGDSSLTEDDISLLRSEAFKIARDETVSPETVHTTNWLEEVMRLLTQARRASTATPATRDRKANQAFFSPGEDCLDAIRDALNQARHTIEICVFTVTDDRISRVIEEAVKRRVRVRLITDDMKSGDMGSDISRLSGSGVDLRIDRSPHHMHHKFAIIDNRVLLTGSYNWTRSAASSNEENIVILHDPKLTADFQRQFKQLWDECADWVDWVD